MDNPSQRVGTSFRDVYKRQGIHIGIQNRNSTFQAALRYRKADILCAVAADRLQNDIHIDVFGSQPGENFECQAGLIRDTYN